MLLRSLFTYILFQLLTTAHGQAAAATHTYGIITNAEQLIDGVLTSSGELELLVQRNGPETTSLHWYRLDTMGNVLATHDWVHPDSTVQGYRLVSTPAGTLILLSIRHLYKESDDRGRLYYLQPTGALGYWRSVEATRQLLPYVGLTTLADGSVGYCSYTSATTPDLRIQRINASGHPLWERQFAGLGGFAGLAFAPFSLLPDVDGGMQVVGQLRGRGVSYSLANDGTLRWGQPESWGDFAPTVHTPGPAGGFYTLAQTTEAPDVPVLRWSLYHTDATGQREFLKVLSREPAVYPLQLHYDRLREELTAYLDAEAAGVRRWRVSPGDDAPADSTHLATEPRQRRGGQFLPYPDGSFWHLTEQYTPGLRRRVVLRRFTASGHFVRSHHLGPGGRGGEETAHITRALPGGAYLVIGRYDETVLWWGRFSAAGQLQREGYLPNEGSVTLPYDAYVYPDGDFALLARRDWGNQRTMTLYHISADDQLLAQHTLAGNFYPLLLWRQARLMPQPDGSLLIGGHPRRLWQYRTDHTLSELTIPALQELLSSHQFIGISRPPKGGLRLWLKKVTSPNASYTTAYFSDLQADPPVFTPIDWTPADTTSFILESAFEGAAGMGLYGRYQDGPGSRSGLLRVYVDNRGQPIRQLHQAEQAWFGQVYHTATDAFYGFDFTRSQFLRYTDEQIGPAVISNALPTRRISGIGFDGSSNTLLFAGSVSGTLADQNMLFGRVVLPQLAGFDTPQLTVYPNPAQRQIRVQLRTPGDATDAARLYLYAANGRLVDTWSLPVVQQTVTTSRSVVDLGAGVYYLHAITAHGAVVCPVLVVP